LGAGGGRTRRHDAPRNKGLNFARSAGCNPELEKSNLLLPSRPDDTTSTQRRPADIYFPTWTHGLPAALDFAITAPQQQGIVGRAAKNAIAAASEYCGSKRNHDNTQAHCNAAGVTFTNGGRDNRGMGPRVLLVGGGGRQRPCSGRYFQAWLSQSGVPTPELISDAPLAAEHSSPGGIGTPPGLFTHYLTNASSISSHAPSPHYPYDYHYTTTPAPTANSITTASGRRRYRFAMTWYRTRWRPTQLLSNAAISAGHALHLVSMMALV
jgi:hypothetical protein